MFVDKVPLCLQQRQQLTERLQTAMLIVSIFGGRRRGGGGGDAHVSSAIASAITAGVIDFDEIEREAAALLPRQDVIAFVTILNAALGDKHTVDTNTTSSSYSTSTTAATRKVRLSTTATAHSLATTILLGGTGTLCCGESRDSDSSSSASAGDDTATKKPAAAASTIGLCIPQELFQYQKEKEVNTAEDCRSNKRW